MNIVQIENNLQKLINTFAKVTFIYDLLLAYGLPKASITRLQKGNLNLSNVEGEISWKKKLFFREEFKEDLHLTISRLQGELIHDQRFLVVTDYETLLAIDTRTDDKLDIALKDLPKYYDFFLPWAGMEKAQHANEKLADVKAAVKMAKLFDEIKKDNPDDSHEFIHGLNVFLSRLLFCFFAEDTHIFKDNQFTNAIDSHTQPDGSDLHTYLDTLFEVLNTPEKDRKNLPKYLNEFPYVNGGLFNKRLKAPHFTRGSRQAILNSGDQDWSAINPDIFGSMFQAVIAVDQRGSLGQHYTSVPNIMKVIEPLFLNDLYEEFEKANKNIKKLKDLLDRLYKIKIFDPACGSGNFLIIAYKELRILEMKIFIEGKMFNLSNIHLSQFYGIEIDDFAHEIAKLALWLAEHQMNVEFFKEFGRTNTTLPLKESGQIVQGNACRLDWEIVCPKEKDSGIYILGNPPYLGARKQSIEQKSDVAYIFEGIKGYNGLDYIACWFYKGAKYLKGTVGHCAFVSTNSLCQGNHVPLFWTNIFKLATEISFAHKAFKWTNNAKDKAGVTVIIVGIKQIGSSFTKYIYECGLKKEVSNISPYLTNGSNLIVYPRTKPFANMPEVVYGNQAIDGGFLTLNDSEKIEIVYKNPESNKFIRRLYGGNSILKCGVQWCIWVSKNNLKEAKKIPAFSKRFEQVRSFRAKGGQVASSLVDIPYRFRYIHEPNKSTIMIPQTSSSEREYLPADIKFGKVQTLHSVQVIYDPDIFIISFLLSKIHFLWAKAVAGCLETRIRYSNTICYNTFPFPYINKQQKDEIVRSVFRIIDEREKHPEKTLAQLYDPDKMPEGLREAHHQNDSGRKRARRFVAKENKNRKEKMK
ncbi:MAG: class I SAM-dependent DNA methyltransferase [Candidatus Anammoxibacter sp.]